MERRSVWIMVWKVRDALLAIFPEKAEDIERHVDPGEWLDSLKWQSEALEVWLGELLV